MGQLLEPIYALLVSNCCSLPVKVKVFLQSEHWMDLSEKLIA